MAKPPNSHERSRSTCTSTAGSFRRSGRSPSRWPPNQANTQHHSPAPSSVTRLYQPNGMRTRPAGMPIRWRTTGTSRAKNTPPASYRASQRSARSSLASGQNKNRPYRTSKGRPSHRGAQLAPGRARQHDPAEAVSALRGPVGRRRDDDLARNRDDGTFHRHQHYDADIAQIVHPLEPDSDPLLHRYPTPQRAAILPGTSREHQRHLTGITRTATICIDAYPGG